MRDTIRRDQHGIENVERIGADQPWVRYVDETDDYTSAVAGVHVETIRVDGGGAANRVVGIPGNDLTVTDSRIGRSMQSRSHIPDDHVVATFVVDVAEASRWCAVPLRPKTVVVYGPGVEHVAINRPGLRFTFGITSIDQILALADESQVDVAVPARGSITTLPVCEETRNWGFELHKITEAALAGKPIPSREGALRSLMKLVAVPAADSSDGLGRRIDSRAIVIDCLDYARAIDRIPSVGELCTVAKVSERRLRSAFTEECDQPPSRFFRAWALQEAHRRFRAADPEATTVTEVATSLGFEHLGRFSGHYRRLYAENPSVTLRTPA